MIVSYKLLKEYIDLEGLSLKEITDSLSLAGFELEGVNTLSSGDHLVIGEVLECVAHPDSDHLHVTKTSIGDETLQIVCGAPNCRKGLKVIVALPGANLPAKGIVIKKGVIRGVESNGMLCSLLELGVNPDMLTDYQKDGIEELPVDAPVGNTNPLDYLGLDDSIIDLSITPNRTDVFGLYKLIIEIAAILNRKIIKKDVFDVKRVGDSVYTCSSDTPNCGYFAMSTIKGVKVKESPAWMQKILKAHDIKCINNIVDIGNYVTLMTGQPLHMYDASKVTSKEFIAKDDMNCDVLALDEKEYKIQKGDVVITNDNKVECVAGILGAFSSMIDENTTTIALETATFNGTVIGKSAKRFGLNTVAATNYSKNAIDKYKILDANDMACFLLVKYADAKEVSLPCIYDNLHLKRKNISINLSFINERLGVNYSKEMVEDVFRRLQFEYKLDGEKFDVIVPTYRNDLEIKEDLIEEIVRLVGFDTVPFTTTPTQQKEYGLNEKQKARKIIMNYLLDNGLTNTLSYSLINPDDATYYNVFDDDEYIVLPHPLTVDKSYLRKNMISSMLQTIFYNQARNVNNVAIFEMSNIYTKQKIEGNERLAIAISGGLNKREWLDNHQVDFYMIKGLVEGLLNVFGLEANRYSFEPLDKYYKDQKIFHPGKSAILKINGKNVGYLGCVHPLTVAREKIADTIYFEMDLDMFLNIKTSKAKYNQVSKFPSVTRDIAIVLKDEYPLANIIKSVKQAGGPLLSSVDVFDLYKGENIEKGCKSIALTLTFVDYEKTLVDATINELFNKIYLKLQQDFNATLR